MAPPCGIRLIMSKMCDVSEPAFPWNFLFVEKTHLPIMYQLYIFFVIICQTFWCVYLNSVNQELFPQILYCHILEIPKGPLSLKKRHSQIYTSLCGISDRQSLLSRGKVLQPVLISNSIKQPPKVQVFI